MSLRPPLIAIGVKTDAGAHVIIETNREFVLSCLVEGGKGAAFDFPKPTVVEGNKLSGDPYFDGAVVKVPALEIGPACV